MHGLQPGYLRFFDVFNRIVKKEHGLGGNVHVLAYGPKGGVLGFSQAQFPRGKDAAKKRNYGGKLRCPGALVLGVGIGKGVAGYVGGYAPDGAQRLWDFIYKERVPTDGNLRVAAIELQRLAQVGTVGG